MAANAENQKTAGKTHRILVVDERRCTGCEVCESVCSMAHDGEFNPLNTRIHRVRIEPILNTSLACQKCYDPDCIHACQLGAISKDANTGLIKVDYDICDGCGACVRTCPYGLITVHSKLNKAIACDLCESTESGEPQCVEYCPKGAIFIEEIDPTINETRLETILKIVKRGFPGADTDMLN